MFCSGSLKEIDAESDDFKNTVAYVQAENDQEFYKEISELTAMLVEAEPENTELQALNAKYQTEYQTAQTTVTEKKPIVENLGLFAEPVQAENDLTNKKIEPLTLGEWIVLIFMLAGIYWILRLIWKGIKKLFKK